MYPLIAIVPDVTLPFIGRTISDEEKLRRATAERDRASTSLPTTYKERPVDNSTLDKVLAVTDSEGNSLGVQHIDSMELFKDFTDVDALLNARASSLKTLKIGDTSLASLGVTPLPIDDDGWDDFNAEIADFNDYLKKSADDHSSERTTGIIAYLNEIRGTAKSRFEVQIEQDCAKLREQLNDNAQVKTKFPDDSAKQKFIDEAVAQYEGQQKNNLHKFDTDIGQKLVLKHREAQQEHLRVIFLANLELWSKENERLLNALRQRRDEKMPSQNDEILVDKTKGELKFSGINVSQLPIITTITNQKITNNNGVFSMRIPYYWEAPFYHASNHRRVIVDLTVMAQAVRASGHSKITMSVKSTSEEDALKTARQAYEACRRARFAEKDIVIKCTMPVLDKDGKQKMETKTYKFDTSKKDDGTEETKNGFKDELFAARPGVYDGITQEIEEIENRSAASLPDLRTGLGVSSASDFRVKFQEYRNAEEAKRLAAAAPDPSIPAAGAAGMAGGGS